MINKNNKKREKNLENQTSEGLIKVNKYAKWINR